MPKDESRIESLKKILYSKDDKTKDVSSGFRLREKNYNLEGDWQHKEELPVNLEREDNMKSFWNKFLIGSVIFFILALGVAFYVYIGGSNVVSGENLEISVSGPVSVSGGEELSYQISIYNKNNVPLDSANLIIEYPSDTRTSAGTSAPLQRYTEEIGKLNSGEKYQKVFKALMFGEENEVKSIKITVEYRVRDSSATFYKEKLYEFVMSSSPVTLSITGPEEASAGSEVTFKVNISSNSTSVIEDVALLTDYPFGFKFISASIKPDFGDRGWFLGDISPKESRNITLKGTIDGQDGEERIFRWRAGIQNDKDKEEIATTFSSNLHQISITRPFVGLGFSINGQSSDTFTAITGDSLRGDIVYSNNIGSPLSNVEVNARLSGSIVSRYDVSAPSGYFRTSDYTVIWNKEKNNSLANLSPGQDGNLSFNIKMPGLSEFLNSSIVNPTLLVKVSIFGNNLSVLDGGDKIVSNSKEIKIKVKTEPKIEASVIEQTTGKIRILLKLRNSVNDLSQTKVNMTLPTYLSWIGNVAPSEEGVSYNAIGGEIVWNAGKVNALTGYSESPRQISFDLGIGEGYELPSNPIVLKNINTSATDDFTGAIINTSSGNFSVSNL